MLKPRYTHVLFDLDGTIYDSLYVNILSLYEVIKKELPQNHESIESLYRFASHTAYDTLRSLGVKDEDYDRVINLWCERVIAHKDEIKLFPGILSVIKWLKNSGCKLAIITSRDRKTASVIGDVASPMPPELGPYFDMSICCNDVENPKPAPDSILKYMNLTGAKACEILYIGDTLADFLCAKDAQVDFGLAVWGANLDKYLKCAHYFTSPWDIINIISCQNPLLEPWYRWAHEIESIGQIGLAYCHDDFDKERYLRLREIASEILNAHLEIPKEKLKNALCLDEGYKTPKVDTRGVVFNEEGKILLVKESRTSSWNLPGGWCDDGETIYSNTKKEVLEEAGMLVEPLKLIAILDRNKHNTPRLSVGVLKAFVLCQKGPQNFIAGSDETSDIGFFSLEEIKNLELRADTTTFEQLEMCFAAHQDSSWMVVVE